MVLLSLSFFRIYGGDNENVNKCRSELWFTHGKITNTPSFNYKTTLVPETSVPLDPNSRSRRVVIDMLKSVQ